MIISLHLLKTSQLGDSQVRSASMNAGRSCSPWDVRTAAADHNDVLQSRRNLTSGSQPSMNPLDEAAKESSAHTGPMSSARDDYALASPLQVVVDTQEGELTCQYR